MLLYPAIGDLMSKVDSRYTLVVETAKRARQLTGGPNTGPLNPSNNSSKAVSLAIEEIMEGKINFVRTREGIK